MVVDVTDANGKPVKFTPFYGALAHAIFFRAGSLDYFHSHICGSDPACAAGFGTPATTGHSTKPGRLELGVLLPGDRALAAVPPGHPPGQAADRAVYAEGAMRRREHAAGLLLGLVLVLLGGRALAYAATPTPLAGELGGPRLPVIAVVALGAAALLSFGVLWLAALGVRERHALELAPGPAPRLSLARFGLDSFLLGGGSLAALRRARDLDPLARRHAHALVAVPRRARAPQRGADPARALARRRGAVLAAFAPRPRLGPARRARPAAPAAAARGDPAAAARRPPHRGTLPGCSRAPCAHAGRPRSPFRSHATRGETCIAPRRAGRSRAPASSSQPSRSHRARSRMPIMYPDEIAADHDALHPARRAERGGERLHDRRSR